LNASTPPYAASHASGESPGGLATYPDQANGRRRDHPLPGPGLVVQRYFTRAGVSPYDEVVWEKRLALIVGEDGRPVFEQRDVEFPQPWSQLATNVVASKYFRGALGSPQREYSVRQLLERVVQTITAWGQRGG
jgi:ribonucleoside-diphosphate reductase alpha chain